MAKKRRNKWYSVSQLVRMWEMHLDEKSNREISKETGISKKSISDNIYRMNNTIADSNYYLATKNMKKAISIINSGRGHKDVLVKAKKGEEIVTEKVTTINDLGRAMDNFQETTIGFIDTEIKKEVTGKVASERKQLKELEEKHKELRKNYEDLMEKAKTSNFANALSKRFSLSRKN